MRPETTQTTVGAMTDERQPAAGPARWLRAIRSRLTGDVRARILAYYLALLALALVASVLIVRQALIVRLDDRISADLVQEVQEFRRLAGGNDPITGEPFRNDVERIFEVFLERNVPSANEQLITVPRQGEAVARAAERASEPLDPALLERWRTLESSERGEIETSDGPVRYLAVPAIADGRTLGSFVVAFFVEREREEVQAAVQILALVSGGVLVVASLFAYLAAGRVLAPLTELRNAASSIGSEEMSRRIEVEGEGELAQLGAAFNKMLDRIETAFTAQRSFIRDASHELRTPIAIVRGHLELLASGDISEEREVNETHELLTGELDRMTRIVNDLLLLARSERPDFLETETVQLDQLCEELIAKARALGDRAWHEDGTARRSIVADRQRLTQAVMGLADNAVANTKPGADISIGADVNGRWARIWVRDSGPGVPLAEQEEIFEPLRRGSGGRGYEGSGLGLALVRAIAEAHDGRVELRSRPGSGTEVELVLPVEGPMPREELRS